MAHHSRLTHSGNHSHHSEWHISAADNAGMSSVCFVLCCIVKSFNFGDTKSRGDIGYGCGHLNSWISNICNIT